MPSQAPTVLFGLCALTALLAGVSNVAASREPSPRVLGLDFHKQIPRNTPTANRLRKRQKSVSVDIVNAEIAYLINMTVGTPPQPFSVQLDTGSSDIWIPWVQSDACLAVPEACQALGAFDPENSSSFQDIGQGEFEIQYQDNSAISGDYILETLVVGKTTVTNLTMGLATRATRPFGIMGIGYDENESIASEDPTQIYPNIISQLKNQGTINTLAYSLWLNDLESLTGSILFGGIDSTKFHGGLIVLPIQKSSKGTYTDFTVALSSINVVDASGKTAFLRDNLALPVILDSGTTATYLPDDIVNPIASGVGVVNDPNYGPILPCSLSSSPAKLNFAFGGTGGPSIEAELSQFITPIYLQDGTQPRYKDGSAVCGFGLLSSETGPILFGDTFLRSAYVVYDLTNDQIAMAQTNFNATSADVVEITGSAIPSATATATGVAATQTYTGIPHMTLEPTKTGGAQETGRASPTFDLGAPSSGSSSNNSAAVALGAPRIRAITIITGIVCLLSVVLDLRWC